LLGASGRSAYATLPVMTTIIRAEAAHDFLALVPTLVGYRPSQSLLCVAFAGNRTAGVLRHDVPRDARGRDALVATVVGTLCRMVQADAVVPVVYTTARFAEGGLPERLLLQGVVRGAEEAGFLVRDALCVAADGWGSLLDDELPATGRALELIDGSPLGRHPEALREPADSAADLVRIPAAEPVIAARVGEILASLRAMEEDGDGGDGRRATVGLEDDPLLELDAAIGDALDPFVAAELLARGDRTRSPEMLAWLVRLASCAPFRDAIMLQVAFGPVIGELALDCADEAADRSADASDRCRDRRPPGSDDGPADLESAEEFLSRLLMGQAGARPDVDRIERALETLVVAIANAPVPDRAGALCMAAWLAWSLGRSSSAGALIDLALEADERHTMARLLRRFIGTGALPDWAFSSPIPGAPEGTDDREVGKAG
jgi:hypothetical protein